MIALMPHSLVEYCAARVAVGDKDRGQGSGATRGTCGKHYDVRGDHINAELECAKPNCMPQRMTRASWQTHA